MLKLVAHRTFFLRTGRNSALCTIKLFLLLQRTTDAYRPTKLRDSATRTIFMAQGPKLPVKDFAGFFREESKLMSLLASVVELVVDTFPVFFRNMGADEVVTLEVLLGRDGDDAFLGVVGASRRERDWLYLEGGGTSMGTPVTGAFSLGGTFEAEVFVAGSFALDWFGALDQADRTLLFRVVGCQNWF